jgi:hypothetical protein
MESLKDLFNIVHANAMELMTIEEGKQFLLAQRKEGCPGKMGSLDTVLIKKEALVQQRQKDVATRRVGEEADRITREEKVVMTSSSSEVEQQATENEGKDSDDPESHRKPFMSAFCPMPKGPTPAKKVRFNLFDTKLSTSLDAAKVSDRRAAAVLIPVLQRLGHDPQNFNISYSFIRRQQIKYRQFVAQCVKMILSRMSLG